ncbi:unnamed protein product, partial [Sphacelaria rigidula]
SPTDNGSHRSHASPSSRGSRQSGSLGRGGVGGGTEDGENCAAKDHQAVESGAAAAKNSSVNNRARAVVEKSQAFSVLPLDLAMMFNGGNSSAPPVGDTPNK